MLKSGDSRRRAQGRENESKLELLTDADLIELGLCELSLRPNC